MGNKVYGVIRLWACAALAVLCVSGGLAFVVSNAGLLDDSFNPAAQDANLFSCATCTEDWYFCFQDVCRCRGHTADCSKNFGRLKFVPRLPETVTTLDFSFNNLSEILRDDFFSNVTNITSLDLSSNGLYNVSLGVFAAFSNLTTLVVNSHADCFTKRLQGFSNVLEAVTAATTLQRLDLDDSCIFEALNESYVYSMPSLQRLVLDNNGLLSSLAQFSSLKFLRELSLGRTEVINAEINVTFEYMEELNLSGSRTEIKTFPTTCSNENTSYFPQLLKLNLGYNFISRIPDNVCLPKLLSLDLTKNSICLWTNSFSTSKFPDLQVLYLYNAYTMPLNGSIFNNSALQYLSISGLLGYNSEIDPDCFKGCPKLTKLDLINSEIPTSDSKVQQLFSTLPSLHRLNLSGCRLTNISSRTFSSLTSLRTLILSNNRLSDIPDGAMDALSHLRELYLDRNQIAVVSDRTFSDVLRRGLEHLDLSDNQLVCNCSVLWFRTWFVTQQPLFAVSRGSYVCANLSPIDMFTFSVSQQSCMLSRRVYLAMFAGTSTVLCCLLAGLAYAGWRLRRRVPRRVALRDLLRMRRLLHPINIDGQEVFDYDVFVSYAEEDSHWVRNYLMPEVEGRLGLRLCLHFRDFHPGRPILDNIEDCVERSRTMVVVFSPYFAASRWCQLELSLGLHHCMERGQDLLTIYLTDVPPHDLTTGMTAVLASCSCLYWAEQGHEAATFWTSLRAALPLAQ